MKIVELNSHLDTNSLNILYDPITIHFNFQKKELIISLSTGRKNIHM